MFCVSQHKLHITIFRASSYESCLVSTQPLHGQVKKDPLFASFNVLYLQ